MKKDDLKNFPNLFQNISNWTEYTFYKGERSKRHLKFTTKPNRIHFEVSASLYWVFKEIFVEDFYRIKQLLQRLPSNPVVIDIGANAGFFDLLVLSKLKEARVFAYEPLESNRKLIQKMVDANPLLQSNLSLFQKAVTGKPVPSIELYVEDTAGNSEIASVFSDFDKRNTRSVSVPAISLSSITEEHPKIDLLKMDCEGSEYDILYNTGPELLQRIQVMAIEVHELDKDKNNLEALNAYLVSMGFRTTVTNITPSTFYLEAYHA
jgi:FkbM family methyltransferase